MERPRTGYIPSLDGWRAIAILGVLITHDLAWTLAGHSSETLKYAGGAGVSLFFTLSGFLITTRIVEEEQKLGHFNVKRFYIRRLFRIQPASLVFLGVVALLILAGSIQTTWHYWRASFFLYANFAYPGPKAIADYFFVGHFWTLSVEEHFYILLSVFLLTIRKRRLAFLAALYLVLALVAHHLVAYKILPEHDQRQTEWQIQALLPGAAAGIALQQARVRAWCVRYLRIGWVALLWLAFFLFHRTEVYVRHPGFRFVTQASIVEGVYFYCEIFFTLLVVATALHATSWTTRLLEWKPLRWIGRLSYSLYLWHVLFFYKIAPDVTMSNRVLQALSGRQVKYVAAFATAALSYYLLEKPMMKLGHKLAPPVTAGRPELLESGEAEPVRTA